MTLRNGDRGLAVRQLQAQLNGHGAALHADGAFGDVTEAAGAAYQR